MDTRYKNGLNPLEVPLGDDKLTPYLEFAKELPQFPS